MTFSKNWPIYVLKGALSDGIKISCTKVGQGGGLVVLEGEFTIRLTKGVQSANRYARVCQFSKV